MAKQYDPKDWYWIVGGNEAQAFSSATGNYVPADDATFAAWKADSTMPTRIASEAELGELLADARVRPQRAAVLDAYKDRHSREVTEETRTKALLWCINEIRTLKGQPTLTTGPAIRAFLKDLM
jgi:hypothetical protein